MFSSPVRPGKRAASEEDMDSSSTTHVKRARTDVKKKKRKNRKSRVASRSSPSELDTSAIPIRLPLPSKKQEASPEPPKEPEASENGDEMDGITETADIGKVTKALEKMCGQLKKLGEAFETSNIKPVADTIVDLRKNVSSLERRRQCDELRAIYRHDMMFNALKKVSEDINALTQVHYEFNYTGSVKNEDGNTQNCSSGKAYAKTPLPDRMRNGRIARQTMEHCLREYMDSLNKATESADIKDKGALCVQYAERLFRSYI